MRAVFGVVNDDKFAARSRKASIERLRLGARGAGWDDHDFDVRDVGDGEGGGDGFDVVAFNEELDVERFGWVVRTYASKGQM